MKMRRIPEPLAHACLFLWAAVLLAVPAFASELVFVQSGELPIVLTAPHGGRENVPGCDLRTPVGSRFVTSTDFNTDVLAEGIAAELTRLTGKPPYLVIARFHRRYIDANRRDEEAYASSGCKAVYATYHAAARRFVDEVRGKHTHAALFDLHGQSAYRDSILRGTGHGATVRSLLARAGAPAVTGPDSVFGRYAAMGYRIAPPNDTSPTARVETRGYTGGHTVQIYGSGKADGIDAMQIEFGRDLRENHVVARTAADTAKAIAVFYDRYLKAAAAGP
jgi:N-formylglutamate amidohydrolase